MQRFRFDRSRLLAAVVAAAALAASPAGAVSYYCSALSVPQQVCAGNVCVFHYKSCFIDFDGLTVNGHEQTALFYENRGTLTDPPFGVDDRSCFQGESFSPLDALPDADDYFSLRFALLLPVGNEDGPFPVLAYLRGGGPGWVDTSQPPSMVNAWALEFDDPGDPSWEKGLYNGMLQLSQGSVHESLVLDFVLDTSGVIAGVREKQAGYGLLFPSGCSNDLWNGREIIEDQGGETFREAERTRFGFDSVVQALRFVEGEYGIEHLFVGGVSGGGAGAFLFAHDLLLTAPELEDEFRGVLADSAAFEVAAWEDLREAGGVEDVLDVDTDGVCTDPPEARVPCMGSETATGHVKVGVTNRSASGDIDADGDNPVAVPILHTWDSRDPAHCYDACYSEENLHGTIRDAIEDRKAGGIDERFDFSVNLEYCVDSCRAESPLGGPGPVVHCVRHGGFHVDEVEACALDWMDAVVEHWDEEDWDTFETPASCLETIVDIDPGTQEPCIDQTGLF